MDWGTVFQMIDSRLLIVVVACWVLGYILKRTPRVPDWTIVYLVTAFALVFSLWLLGITPEAVLQGILCGAVAVYSHQLLKQAQKKAEEDND